ncbi:HAD hydrolase-like protein [Stenotrophomonas sp. JC08]|uniref:HAD hydrolase-like protein n=1 Tax=Stenotrophomonas sp. JC08 TaxID=3445779 RepID=UPI003FA32EA8
MSRDVLFFDLDGTLIQSSEGVTRCVAYALEKMGQPVPAMPELRKWIGPALRTSFAPVFGDTERVERAVALYRERFESDGWKEYELYPGIEAVVRSLKADGHRMAIVTAKTESHAQRIVEHLPFGDCFEDVTGASLDSARSHKPQLVGEALRRLSLQPEQCWMIGDRRMDIEGARHHGMRNIGVLWGFGGREELQAAGAHALAATPDELVTLLRA